MADIPETFDEQLSRFDLMCEGDPKWDLSDNDLAALLAVRTEMRIMARATLASQERIASLTEANRLNIEEAVEFSKRYASLEAALKEKERELEASRSPLTDEEWKALTTLHGHPMYVSRERFSTFLLSRGQSEV